MSDDKHEEEKDGTKTSSSSTNITRSDDEWWPFNIENEGIMPLLHTIIGRY